MLLMWDVRSVGVLGTILMIVRKERVASSVRKKVISRLNARRMLLVTIVGRQAILVLSIPSQRRQTGRSSLWTRRKWSSRIILSDVCVLSIVLLWLQLLIPVLHILSCHYLPTSDLKARGFLWSILLLYFLGLKSL